MHDVEYIWCHMTLHSLVKVQLKKYKQNILYSEIACTIEEKCEREGGGGGREIIGANISRSMTINPIIIKILILYDQ